MSEFVKPRSMSDGSVVYPTRGSPPPDLAGYSRDPGNPFHFLPIWPECANRQEGQYTSPCCPENILRFKICLKGFEATLDKCKKCIAEGKNL